MFGEIKIGKDDVAEALKHVTDSFAEMNKNREEKQRNVTKFSEAVEKLANKHKVLFFLQAFDKDSTQTTNYAPFTVAIKYGFESLHDFAHVLEANVRELSETAHNSAIAAGMLLEEHCPGTDESEEPKHE